MSYNDLAYDYFKGHVQTAFKEGRAFRTFKELNIPASGSYVVKITLPVPVYFTGFDLAIDTGSLKVETVSGGTAGGTFAETLPRIKANLTEPTDYVVQTLLTAGGTHTGGTIIDVVRQKTDGNATRSASVIQSELGVRGVAAGTYHWRFTNLSNDAVVGTFKVLWEEPEL